METRTRLVAATRQDVRVLGIVAGVEALLVALYFPGTPGQVTRSRYVLYPFV